MNKADREALRKRLERLFGRCRGWRQWKAVVLKQSEMAVDRAVRRERKRTLSLVERGLKLRMIAEDATAAH